MDRARRSMLLGSSTIAALAVAGLASRGHAETSTMTPRERVDGIGGLFFRSRDPKTLAQWYSQNLGIDPIPTDYEHESWHQSAGPTAFAPFAMNTNYFGRPEQSWMVNFRVKNLDAMVSQLRSDGITVNVDSQNYPNGRFAHLHDPEGNPIELWEPAGRDRGR